MKSRKDDFELSVLSRIREVKRELKDAQDPLFENFDRYDEHELLTATLEVLRSVLKIYIKIRKR